MCTKTSSCKSAIDCYDKMSLSLPSTYDYKLFGNYQYLNAITTVTQISPIPLTCPTGQVLIERFCCSTGYYLDGIDCVKSCPYNKLLNSVSKICESPKDGLCQTEKQLRDYKTCVTTCPTGRIVDKGICRCPNGAFIDFDANKNTISCVASCLAPKVASANGWSCECHPYSFRIGETCVSQCPLIGYPYRASSSSFECVASCLGLIENNTCIDTSVSSCPNRKVNIGSFCVCPSDSYLDSSTGMCVSKNDCLSLKSVVTKFSRFSSFILSINCIYCILAFLNVKDVYNSLNIFEILNLESCKECLSCY